jgi:ABC transport system ATP-binding/permease protein
VTSLVQRLSRTAWLRLTLGRNEGKEWIVDAPQTFIGRSEKAHVPLFGDPSIAPMHACIVRQGGNYLLADGGSPVGTYLNGQRIQQVPLFHGAVIRVGTLDLQFLMRAGKAPQYAPEQVRAGAYPYLATSPGGYPPTPAQPVGAQTYATPQTMPTMAPQPMPQQAMPALVVMSGPMSGQRFEIRQAIEIGREASGISMSTDGSASRRHAMISPTPNGPQLTDLNSTNGTFVNEQRVQNAMLRAGDIVRIGTTTFRVE